MQALNRADEGRDNDNLPALGSQGDPDEALLDGSEVPSTRKAKYQKTLQAMFKGIGREKYFQAHVKNQDQIPPVGAHKPRWESVEPKKAAPLYGTRDTWGGGYAK